MSKSKLASHIAPRLLAAPECNPIRVLVKYERRSAPGNWHRIQLGPRSQLYELGYKPLIEWIDTRMTTSKLHSRLVYTTPERTPIHHQHYTAVHTVDGLSSLDTYLPYKAEHRIAEATVELAFKEKADYDTCREFLALIALRGL